MFEIEGSVELPPVGIGAQPARAAAASNTGRACAGRHTERSRDVFIMRYVLLYIWRAAAGVLPPAYTNAIDRRGKVPRRRCVMLTERPRHIALT